MLAAHDQENLFHGHQATAAGKPLNNGVRQLPPKTPSNKPFKTPLKLPLNDENGANPFGGGKTGGKTMGQKNENLLAGGKPGGLVGKNAFVTPMGPRNRAPLGMKTTNAKAKALQTPAPVALDDDAGNKISKSATARKPKLRISHAEPSNIDVLGDSNELEEREIEYMPPPAIPLPDLPDDMPHDLDLSMFENGGLTRNYMSYFNHRVEADGLSYIQRRERDRKKVDEKSNKIFEASILRDIESAPMPCVHLPDCPGDECKVMPEIRRKAEEKFKKTMAALDPPKGLVKTAPSIPKAAPSDTLSRHGVSTLSQAKPLVKSVPNLPEPKSRVPFSQISSRKKTPAPTNPSPMRHTAAAAASKTTVGYSRGRTASANIRNLHSAKDLPTTPQSDIPDTDLPPALYIQRYGVPKIGTEMYMYCKNAGCFDEYDRTEALKGAARLEALWREEAEKDFELTF